MPRRAIRLGEEAVGLLIADKALGYRIPLQLAPQLVGDVGDNGQDDDVIAHVYRHHRPLPRLDALQPVLPVAGALEDMHAVGGRLIVPGLFLRVAATVAAGDDQRIPVAVVFSAPGNRLAAAGESVALAGLAPGQGPVRVFKLPLHLHRHRHVPHAFFGWLPGGLHADRAGIVRVHAPHHQAQHVVAPVADEAGPEIHHPAEIEMHVLRVIGLPARRSQPHIPIQLRGRRLLLAPAVRPVVLVPDLYVTHLADLAVADILAGSVRIGLRAALRADLHHAPVTLGRVDHRLPFLDRLAGRLLAVDILARL